MKRLLRLIGGLLLGLVVLLTLGTLVPRPLVPRPSEGEEATHHILVLSNPIHTDIAIPIDDKTLEMFAFLKEAGIPIDAPNAGYLIFGRGGREFYISTPTWSELKPVPLMKGLTLDRAAMHVDVASKISERHPNVVTLEVSDAGYDALLSFIEDSFARQGSQPILIPGVQYGQYDRFYEANGYFTAALGCNTWTAQGLREAGVRTGWWNPIPATLLLSLDLYN